MSDRKHPFAAFIKALKEWGGAATLLIAILYTFPFDAIDRFSKWRERDVLITRQALAEAATISIDAAKSSIQLNNPDIAQWYQAKFFNVVYANKDAFKRAIPSLKSNEVQQFAGYLVLTGQVPESLPFYDVAVEKAKQEDVPYYNYLRDKAKAYYALQNSTDGRKTYAESLKIIATTNPPLLSLQAIYVYELARLEKNIGDWQCGASLETSLEPIILQIASMDRFTKSAYDQMRSMPVIQRENQSNVGCPDLLELIPKLPPFLQTVTAPPQTGGTNITPWPQNQN